jgi:hypothetical protein
VSGVVEESPGGASASWYSVRSFYRWDHEVSDPGHALPPTFEERVTLWEAPDAEAALLLAEAEADEYAEDLDFERLPLLQAFHLSEEPGAGKEIFSLMRDSALESAAYLRRYFDDGAERQQTELQQEAPKGSMGM